MEIDNVRRTIAWMRSMQYEGRPDMESERRKEEDAALKEERPEAKETDMDRVDFQEGDQALTQLRQEYGKSVYETVVEDPALAWSVKGQTWPPAVHVDRNA